MGIDNLSWWTGKNSTFGKATVSPKKNNIFSRSNLFQEDDIAPVLAGAALGAYYLPGMGIYSLVGGGLAGLGAKDFISGINKNQGNQKQTISDSYYNALNFLEQAQKRQEQLQKPFREAGLNALEKYESLSRSPMNIEESPYYKFQKSKGEKAINQALAARGKYFSGAAISALNEFNQNLLANETERAYNRKRAALEDQLRLFGIGANVSANQASQTGQTGTQLANLTSAYGKDIAGIETAQQQNELNKLMLYLNLLQLAV